MQSLPHHYSVHADGLLTGVTVVSAAGVPPLQVAAPLQFDGPVGLWSPETLLVGAVAECFVLTFRTVARAAGFPWRRLQCDVEGTLARSDGELRFTGFTIRADLTVLTECDLMRAQGLLQRAERNCLIGNSLRAARTLELQVHAHPAAAA
ncbi:MAG: OsmC family protein [Steroidobacteraceae bacterium]